jgi:hypothetical protein
MNKPISDDELIREIERWGKHETPESILTGEDIRGLVDQQSRASTRRALFICSVIATAMITFAMLSNFPVQAPTKREVAAQPLPPELDPKQILQSLANRTHRIESRIESLNSLAAMNSQMDIEMQEINTRILNHKRTAIRNQIALNPIP